MERVFEWASFLFTPSPLFLFFFLPQTGVTTFSRSGKAFVGMRVRNGSCLVV